jgi:hypothetical protein
MSGSHPVPVIPSISGRMRVPVVRELRGVSDNMQD